MTATTDRFVAAIGTAPDVVTGDTCDLTVNTEIISGYDLRDGAEVPIHEMGSDNILSTQLAVRLDDEDRDDKATAEADEFLTANGLTRVSGWEYGSNALYATVVRD